MILELRNTTKIYRKGKLRFTALKNVSFAVTQGDFVAVLGPSGSGKSTLLHTVGGLIHPDQGQVFYKGNNLYELSNQKANQYRREQVGFVFQQFHLMPYLTVYENIKLATGKNHSKKQTIQTLLEKCALLPLQHKFPSELSVGEKQRTAFIRAIVTQPEILLADEPTGNLDPENSQAIMELIKDFHTSGGTVLLVSHEAAVSNFASRSVHLKEGEIIQLT